MKKFIKSTLLVIGATFATLLFTNLFLNAWDNTMTDEEIVYYLEQYPTEEKLIKLAERRNLIEKVEWSHFSKKIWEFRQKSWKLPKVSLRKREDWYFPFIISIIKKKCMILTNIHLLCIIKKMILKIINYLS